MFLVRSPQGTIRTATPFAMKSWRYEGTRFFASLLAGDEPIWYLWVTAICGKTETKKLRAEIRLSSNLVPDCNDVFYRPGTDKNKQDNVEIPQIGIFSR